MSSVDGSPASETRSGIRGWVIEAMVIVGSILFAFAIDAAWDSRGEASRNEALIENLRLEVRENLAALDDAAAARVSTIASVDQLLLFSNSGVPTSVPADSIHSLLLGWGWFENSRFSTAALDAIGEAGPLSVFEEEELATGLIQLRQGLEQVAEIVETDGALTYASISPWMQENVEMIGVFGSMAGAVPAEYPVPSFPVDAPEYDVGAALEGRRVRNLLAVKRSIIADIEYGYESVLRPLLMELDTRLEER